MRNSFVKKTLMSSYYFDKYNITILADPPWTRPFAAAAEVFSIVVFSGIAFSVMLIIIGRNVIPSLMFNIMSCFAKNKDSIKRKRAASNVKSRSEEFTIANICQRQEVTTVSLFFLFFLFYCLYRVWTGFAMCSGYSSQIATDSAFESFVVMTIADAFDFIGFIFFLVFFCFYIVVLSQVAGIWFFMIDITGKKKKVFQIVVGLTIVFCMCIGTAPIIVIVGIIHYEIYDSRLFYIVTFSVATLYVLAQVILTILAIAIIVFIVRMIKKHSRVETMRSEQNETISKLKIYSLKLIAAIIVLFIAVIIRTIGTLILGFNLLGVPIFVATITARIIPDLLDMGFCVIIYWPFPLLCGFEKSGILKKVLNPINFAAMYNKLQNENPPTPTEQSGEQVETSPPAMDEVVLQKEESVIVAYNVSLENTLVQE